MESKTGVRSYRDMAIDFIKGMPSSEYPLGNRNYIYGATMLRLDEDESVILYTVLRIMDLTIPQVEQQDGKVVVSDFIVKLYAAYVTETSTQATDDKAETVELCTIGKFAQLVSFAEGMQKNLIWSTY